MPTQLVDVKQLSDHADVGHVLTEMTQAADKVHQVSWLVSWGLQSTTRNKDLRKPPWKTGWLVQCFTNIRTLFLRIVSTQGQRNQEPTMHFDCIGAPE